STDEWWGRVHPADRAQLQVDITAQMAGSGDRFSTEHRIRHEDGRWLRVEWTGIIVRDAEGRAMRAAGSVRDTPVQRGNEEGARWGGVRPGVRAGLRTRAPGRGPRRRARARTRRHGDRRFAVLPVDIAGFSRRNDSPGRAVGDELLRGVAKRLAPAVRPGDGIA